jgi:hypothetical protein
MHFIPIAPHLVPIVARQSCPCGHKRNANSNLIHVPIYCTVVLFVITESVDILFIIFLALLWSTIYFPIVAHFHPAVLKLSDHSESICLHDRLDSTPTLVFAPIVIVVSAVTLASIVVLCVFCIFICLKPF